MFTFDACSFVWTFFLLVAIQLFLILRMKNYAELHENWMQWVTSLLWLKRVSWYSNNNRILGKCCTAQMNAQESQSHNRIPSDFIKILWGCSWNPGCGPTFRSLQWRCLYCNWARVHILASNESSPRQTNKVKILAAVDAPWGRYSIFTVLAVGLYKYIRIMYINFLYNQLSISIVSYKNLSKLYQ
jgi:hypothetical protein